MVKIDVATKLGIMGAAHASGQINLWHLGKGGSYTSSTTYKSSVTFLKVLSPLKGVAPPQSDVTTASEDLGATAAAATEFHTVSVDIKGQVYRGGS